MQYNRRNKIRLSENNEEITSGEWHNMCFCECPYWIVLWAEKKRYWMFVSEKKYFICVENSSKGGGGGGDNWIELNKLYEKWGWMKIWTPLSNTNEF